MKIKCKVFYLAIPFAIMSSQLKAQILLEDKNGDQIANNAPIYANTGSGVPGINLSLIKLNTGDQSLGFNYITTTKNFNPSNYRINEFGIKARPTEGYAAVFSNGQFSPGIRASYSYTKVPLLKTSSNYTDWGGFSVNYDIDRYALFRRDTVFANQFSTKTFRGINLGLNYNALINSIWILNFKVGYSRRNNYDDLNSIDAEDYNIINDPASRLVRQIIRKRTAKEGIFKEFDAYPFILAFTKATSSDDPSDPDPVVKANSKKLKIGYTVYFKNLASEQLPKSDMGLIFFLTQQDNKQNKGVRTPVFGLNIQASDPFDVEKQKNSLLDKITVGFTSIFSL